MSDESIPSRLDYFAARVAEAKARYQASTEALTPATATCANAPSLRTLDETIAVIEEHRRAKDAYESIAVIFFDVWTEERADGAVTRPALRPRLDADPHE